jgi:general secretion pathway protein A
LIARYQRKLTTVIVVDEAHSLGTDVLEEVRLLTNLETAEQKLLQVLLVGQPELAQRLDSFELRQLKQRVALRTYLEPLDLEETRGYIRRRLQVAGAHPDGNLIPDETVAAIYRFSGGIPRLINTICENALITTFARALAIVPPEIVVQAAKDLCLEATAESRIELGFGDNHELNHAAATMRCLRDRLQDIAEEREQSSALDKRLNWPAIPSLKPFTDS